MFSIALQRCCLELLNNDCGLYISAHSFELYLAVFCVRAWLSLIVGEERWDGLSTKKHSEKVNRSYRPLIFITTFVEDIHSTFARGINQRSMVLFPLAPSPLTELGSTRHQSGLTLIAVKSLLGAFFVLAAFTPPKVWTQTNNKKN